MRAHRRRLRFVRWFEVLALAFVALIATGAEAHAYCRTTTVPILSDFQPRPDRCWTQGVPLFWRSACIAYSVQRDASKQIPFEVAASELSAAFTKWTRASCPSGDAGSSRVGIDVRDLGAVECAKVDYNLTGSNQNVILFHDDAWPHGGSEGTLALTTVTFDPETGEIYDGDMEINTAAQRVTVGDPTPLDGYDFASIVTHEAGHFFGLAHSGELGATMYASYAPGNTAMRNLTSDDVAGLCAIYPPSGVRAVFDATITQGTCDPTPRRGFTGACAEPAPKSSCEATASPGGGASPAWLGAGIGGALLLAVRARRRRRRAGPSGPRSRSSA